jgi:LPS sulfotransferase NodH
MGDMSATRITKKFVVFSTPRSGSSHLISLLDSHAEINCLGELYNHQGGALRDLGLKSKQVLYKAGTEPLGFLQDVMDMMQTREICKPVFGFKLMLHHDPRVIDFILAHDEWRVIVLERRNRLGQWSSMKLAKATGKWGANKGDAPAEPPPKVKFDTRNFEQYCFRMDAKYESMYHRLGARPIMKLATEEIDRRHAELLDYLGVDSSIAQQLESRRERQNSSSMRDRIDNYDAYVRYAEGHSLPVH